MKDFDKHRRADLNDVLCKIAERGYVFVWTVYGSTKTRSCWKTGTVHSAIRPSSPLKLLGTMRTKFTSFSAKKSLLFKSTSTVSMKQDQAGVGDHISFHDELEKTYPNLTKG